MKPTVFLAILFLAFAAGADEPDLSQLEARMQETRSRLALTEKQMAQLKPILEDHFDAQMAILDKYGLSAENRPDAQTLRVLRLELDQNKTNTSKHLSGILSRAQLAEFEKIQIEWKKQIQEKLLSKRTEDIGAKLGLTEEQMAQLKPILADQFDAQMAVMDKHGIALGDSGDRGRLGLRKLRALRRDLDKISDNTSKRLSGILSKAQLAEFEKIQKEQREQMREKLR